MGLEAGDHIADLDANNPLGSDVKSEGDDHLRLVKRCVQGSFPAFVGTLATPKSVSLTEDQLSDAAQKSAAQTITGAWRFNTGPTLGNTVDLFGRNVADDASFDLVHVDTADRTIFGDANSQQINQCKTQNQFLVDGVNTMFLAGLAAGGVIVIDLDGNQHKAGFRNPRLQTFSASRALAQDDEGRILQMTSGPVTITIDQLEEFFTCRLIVTGAGGLLTLLKGNVTNMRWLDGSGSLNAIATGVTVQRGSVVEIWYSSTVTMYVFGNGITEI